MMKNIQSLCVTLQTRSIVFKSGGGGKLTRNLDSKKSYLNQKAKSTDLQIGGKGGGGNTKTSKTSIPMLIFYISLHCFHAP